MTTRSSGRRRATRWNTPAAMRITSAGVTYCRNTRAEPLVAMVRVARDLPHEEGGRVARMADQASQWEGQRDEQVDRRRPQRCRRSECAPAPLGPDRVQQDREQQDGNLLRQRSETGGGEGAEKHRGRQRLHPPQDQEQREGGEEAHRRVDKHLSRDDHVVRHDRAHGGGGEPGDPTAERPSDQVAQHHRADAEEHRHDESSGEVALAEDPEGGPDHGLEQQRMGAEQ